MIREKKNVLQSTFEIVDSIRSDPTIKAQPRSDQNPCDIP